ncbi:MAG: hypothetical protein Q7U07_06955 [Gammaproteobacteria bacterium]|nr:hypothetical protein [Gammaproteobacteria bacterium]
MIGLTDHQEVITVLANDSGLEEIFVRQLCGIGRLADTVAITAFDGCQMKAMADDGIHVPTEPKEYGPAEDAHMILDHLVGAYLMRYVRPI